VSVVPGRGDGTLGSKSLYGAGEDVFSALVADLALDGDLDVATTNLDAETVSILFNRCLDEPGCPGDLDDDGLVGFTDLVAVLDAWGKEGGPEDLDRSGAVDFGDVLIVLDSWGPCPA